MAENPLLPHSKLREMYALMLRCRELDRKSERLSARQGGAPSTIAREALLAATAMHLAPGDLLSPLPGDRTAASLVPSAKPKQEASAPATRSARRSTKTSVPGEGLLSAPQPEAGTAIPLPRLGLCAAAARAQQAARTGGVVLAIVRTGSAAGPDNGGWAAALEWAQSAQLPLLLACADIAAPPAGSRRSRPVPGRASASASRSRTPELPLTLSHLQVLAERLKLPILPVEGEDPVALYRVMQESALRARMGGGPAVIWAVMSPLTGRGALPVAQQPVARLKRYMAERKIALK